MQSTSETLFLVVGATFLASSFLLVIFGLVFDFWYERRHKRLTGRPLFYASVPPPLMSGVHAGLALLAPRNAPYREQCSIRLATPFWQWASRINAVVMVLVAATGIFAFGIHALGG